MRKLVLLLVTVLAFNLSNAQEQAVFKFKSTKQLVHNIYGDDILNQLNRYFIYNKDENTLYEYKTKNFKKVIQTRELGKVWIEGDWRLKCNAIQSANARQGESFLIKAVDSFTGKTFTIEITVSKWIE
jgi:hypothetical protein